MADAESENDGCCLLTVRFIKLYWKGMLGIAVLFLPLVIILIDNVQHSRCIYVNVVILLFLALNLICPYITAMLPLLLCPLASACSASPVTSVIYRDMVYYILGGTMLVTAIEHSELDKRIAVWICSFIGCGYQRLTLFIAFVTMFFSMWIPNISALQLMGPIVFQILKELEQLDIVEIYVGKKGADLTQPDLTPTPVATCFYLSTIYAATIGGIGSISGTVPNMFLKDLVDGDYDKHLHRVGYFIEGSEHINYLKWILYNLPGMLVMTIGMWLILQVYFLGMFRSGREQVGDKRQGANTAIAEKYKGMDRINLHQILVIIIFVIFFPLLVTRRPSEGKGWAPKGNLAVRDLTTIMTLSCIYFALPSNSGFLNAFSKYPEKRPTKCAPSLLVWRIIQSKTPWGFLFLVGCGFSLQTANSLSGLEELISDKMATSFASTNKNAVLFLALVVTALSTQVLTNTIVAGLTLPVLGRLAVYTNVNPLYYMIPVTVMSSMSFTFPHGTGTCTMGQELYRVRCKDMILCGLFVLLLCFVVEIITWFAMGPAVFDAGSYPEWAWRNATNFTRPV